VIKGAGPQKLKILHRFDQNVEYYHLAKFGGAWISPAAGAAKNVEFLPAAFRAAQAADIYFTERQISRFFAPQGRHVARMVSNLAVRGGR